MISATIVYVSHRSNPHFDWFVDSLCNQADFDQRRHLQLVFVDGKLWADGAGRTSEFSDGQIAFANPAFHNPDRRVDMEQIVNNRIEFLHVPPLPCVFSGPFRLTPSDWFAASNTRNTGWVVARHAHTLFCDDLTVLMPGWLANGLHSAEGAYVVAGMYKKVRKLDVAGGIVMGCEEFEGGIDSRWPHSSPAGIIPYEGSMFGCSFGIPLEKALDVDGFAMEYCGEGGEDYDFSIRLRRAGNKIFLNRNMLTFESEEDHHNQPFKDQAARNKKTVLKKQLPPAYGSYKYVKKEKRFDSDHVLLNRVCNEPRTLPTIGLGLRKIRQSYLSQKGLVPIPNSPTVDWRDAVPLKDA